MKVWSWLGIFLFFNCLLGKEKPTERTRWAGYRLEVYCCCIHDQEVTVEIANDSYIGRCYFGDPALSGVFADIPGGHGVYFEDTVFLSDDVLFGKIIVAIGYADDGV